VNSVAGKLVEYMKDTNKYSYFVKDDERVTGTVEKGDDIVTTLNNILKKIINLNCVTKVCYLKELLEKFRELKAEIEK